MIEMVLLGLTRLTAWESLRVQIRPYNWWATPGPEHFLTGTRGQEPGSLLVLVTTDLYFLALAPTAHIRGLTLMFWVDNLCIELRIWSLRC